MALPTLPTATITGDANNNYLLGTSGADTISGLAGTNTLEGLSGDDNYIVGSATDLIIEAVGEGTDTVYASVNYTLGNEVENIAAVGSTVTIITGNAKDNILDSLQASGSVSLRGGSGNDTYFLKTGDTITDTGGTDIVISTGDVDLAGFSTVENATGSGTIGGNALGNRLIGGSGVDSLTGLGGNDVLDGGAGADNLAGGSGDDIYIFGTGDTITESASAGTDTVKSSVTVAALADNVEKLTLTGISDINGTGNGSINVLRGNSGNNILDGGALADSMAGLQGNDTYNVDVVGDVVTEAAGEGTDTIISAITITSLAANVENLDLSTASGAVNGTGNVLANTITGNGQINILNGGSGTNIVDILNGGGGNDILIGGSGADQLNGEAGADTYRVDADDVISDSGAGVDKVEFTGTAGQTYTLTDVDVENITLMGTLATNATGNSGNNTMNGNSANNVLNSGGSGNDKIFGGGGNDTITSGSGNDTINGGAGKDTVITGSGNDKIVFATGNTDSKAAATATPTAGIDLYSDLDFGADKLSLLANVDVVNTAVSGTVDLDATFISDMNLLLSVDNGEGFDTDTSGAFDISAAIVDGGASGTFLAVDLDHSNTFTVADFVIEITGSTGTLTDSVFI